MNQSVKLDYWSSLTNFLSHWFLVSFRPDNYLIFGIDWTCWINSIIKIMYIMLSNRNSVNGENVRTIHHTYELWLGSHVFQTLPFWNRFLSRFIITLLKPSQVNAHASQIHLNINLKHMNVSLVNSVLFKYYCVRYCHWKSI